MLINLIRIYVWTSTYSYNFVMDDELKDYDNLFTISTDHIFYKVS